MFWLVIRKGSHEIVETEGGRPPQDTDIAVLGGFSTHQEAEAKMLKDQNPGRPRWA